MREGERKEGKKERKKKWQIASVTSLEPKSSIVNLQQDLNPAATTPTDLAAASSMVHVCHPSAGGEIWGNRRIAGVL